jgi:hypothetical protein
LSPKNARSGASALVALALLLLLASPALAGEKSELRPEVTVEQDYDTNIFLLPDASPNKKGSPVTIVRPSLYLEEDGTLGQIYLDGWISSHTYWDESDLSGVDRGVGGGLDRTITPRLSLFGNGSYMRIAPHSEIRTPADVSFISPQPGQPTTPVITPGQLVEGSVPMVDLGQGEFGGRYQLTPRSKLELSGGPFSINYLSNPIGRTDLRDRDGWFTSLKLTHDMTYLDRLTFELSANSTDEADAIFRTATVQDPFNPHQVDVNTGKDISNQQSFSIGWERTWNELWTSHVQLGVRRLDSETKGANRSVTRVGPPITNGDVTPFIDFVSTDFNSVGPGVIGELTIRRVMPRGRAQLSYVRETRTTSSLFSSNVNVDTVSLAYIHNLSLHSWLTITGSYEHYATVNDAPTVVPAGYVPGSFNPITGPSFTCGSSAGKLVIVGSGVDKGGQCQFDRGKSALQADLYYGEARFDWQLRKRLSTFATVRYTQRTGDPLLFGVPFNKFVFGVGFTWDYSLGL